MNYTEVKTSAYEYADRSNDVDAVARYDDFLRFVESYMNRKFKTLDTATTDSTPLVSTISQIITPADFGGVRHIVYTDASGEEHTMKMSTPQKVMDMRNVTEQPTLPTDIYYSVGNGTINFSRDFEAATGSIDLHYYRKVSELNSVDTTNWVSTGFPDAYVFGVISEISAFVKDGDSASAWLGRLDKVIEEIIQEDTDRRWGGEPLQMRTA